MKNDPRSHGLWEHSAPPAPPTTVLDRDIVADVVIVGAGYTGLSAALTLAEEGRSCVVLDAEEIGFGGSGRNVGLVNAGLWLQPDEVRQQLGDVYGERILTYLDQAPSAVFDLIRKHDIACEALRPGTLHCAVGEKGARQLRERERQWQKFGAPVMFLDAAQTEHLTGSSAYHGSLLDQRAGTIQPLAYARGLAGAALNAGARIHTGSRVMGACRLPGGDWKVQTDNGSVTTPWVIVATNAYTVSPWSSIRSELVHLPYFNIATVPLPPDLRATVLPESHGIWDTEEILTSVRMDQAGRLVIGSVGALRGGGQAIHKEWSRRAMERLFPQLKGVAFESGWWGSIGMTSDNVPRFHHLDERVVTVCGYNGRGIGPGTVFGRAVAELILGKHTSEDMPLPMSAAVPVRFRNVQEAWYEVGASAAHLVMDRF
ncbi:FAD-binding oxidoreductase [Gluconobacter sp. LMG 31484]|uniref:FAD-binding oxidoreductase n=1 Tax=Gluconobacter vitians TaxID=2728102 RepID=A0ABR9Y7Z2_9PROT|nr:FAD-binding oxidoreductase [Gluconobacter vitians]MBF0859529.1 FAD-binding oxidoreductase [Gluconobacter vitians]